MVIQKMARAMLHKKDVVRNLWGEAVNTACHTINKVYFRLGTKKTPYELWKGRKPNVKYFKIFESTCFILKDRENVRKFDSQSEERIFFGILLQGLSGIQQKNREGNGDSKCCY